MKTKKFFLSLFMASVAMAGFTACSEDEPKGGSDNGAADGEGAYVSLTVTLPNGNGSRSQTVTDPDPGNPGGASTDGTEVGSDKENYVGEVLLVIASAKNNAFAASGLSTNFTAQNGNTNFETKTKLTKTQIEEYYQSESFTQEVNIFVFCNPTKALKDMVGGLSVGNTQWVDDVTNATSSSLPEIAGLGGKGSFFMSNYQIAKRLFPATVDSWETYNTEDTPFDLSGANAGSDPDNSVNNTEINGGPVKVHRAAARFDFRDGSALGNYTYTVVTEGENKTPIVQVEISSLSLANISKSFYTLERVSADGMPANALLCGAEIHNNYVVGPNAADFANISTVETNGFSKYFYAPLFADTKNNNGVFPYGEWDTTPVSFFKNAVDDNYTGGDHKPGDYKVWRYTTENVIPSAEGQKNGISVAVVFRTQMKATEAAKNSADEYTQALYEALNNTKTNLSDNPVLFVFNKKLYCGWDNVVKAALQASVKMDADNNPVSKKEENAEGNEYTKFTLTDVNRSEPLYVAVFGNGGIPAEAWKVWGSGETLYEDTVEPDAASANSLYTAYAAAKDDTKFNTFRNKAVEEDFYLYEASVENGKAGYYCQYFYFNRHNDNKKPGTMGVMEFATVRNNVYKLAVTNIKQLGHPIIPDNDPDKPTPDTDDESDDVYLSVSCEVLPWVVRINNIEF